jgi:hypothetical protein
VTRSMKIGMLGLCLVSMLTVSALGASSALAKKNPILRWCAYSTVLGTGGFLDRACNKESAKKEGEFEAFGLANFESVTLASEANGTQVLQSKELKLKIECAELKVSEKSKSFGGEDSEMENLLKEGRYRGGSKSEIPSIEYRKCKVTEPEKECEVNGVGAKVEEINTKEVTSNLVWETKKSAEAEAQEEGTESRTLLVFKPKTGKTFVEIELKGAKCPAAVKEKPIGINGEVLARVAKPLEHSSQHSFESLPTTKFYFVNTPETTERKIKVFDTAGFTSEYKGNVFFWQWWIVHYWEWC